jgi:hypothetical protein
MTMTSSVREWAERQAREYKHGADRPLGGYTMMLGAYGALVGGLTAIGRLARRRIPEHLGVGDVALLGVATHRLSRTIAKDPITSPLRAPFTRYDGPGPSEELMEQVRGHGLQHSIGELVACPMCLAQWCATGLAAGLVIAPRQTRLVMATLTAVGSADFLQYVYEWLRQAAESSSS